METAALLHGSSSVVCVRPRQSSGKVSALLKDLNHPAEERFTLTSGTCKLVNKKTERESHPSSLKARTHGPLRFKAGGRGSGGGGGRANADAEGFGCFCST